MNTDESPKGTTNRTSWVLGCTVAVVGIVVLIAGFAIRVPCREFYWATEGRDPVMKHRREGTVSRGAEPNGPWKFACCDDNYRMSLWEYVFHIGGPHP